MKNNVQGIAPLKIACFVFFVFSFMCPIYAQETAIEQEVHQFSLAGYDEAGQKKWELEGQSANIVAETIELNNITAHAFGPDRSATLTAETGVFDRVKKELVLNKNVRAQTSDGIILLAENVKWEQGKNEISTEQAVDIQSPQVNVHGTGAVVEPTLKTAQVKKDITCQTLKPKTVITCDGPLEIDYNTSQAIFHNKVHVQDARAEMRCDELTVTFDTKEKKVLQVHAKGSTEVIQGDNKSFSDEAVYDVESQKIKLIGRPRLEFYTEQQLPFGEKKPDAPAKD